MTLTKIEAKTWFLASGTKKVGPMTRSRLRERVAESRTPARLRAWREGMDAWLPVAEIPELDGSSAKVAAVDGATDENAAVANAAAVDSKAEDSKAVAAPDAPAAPARPSRLGRSLTASKSASRSAVLSGSSVSPPATTAFVAHYRITKTEIWRAFAMGFEAPRLKLAGLLLAAGIALQVGVLGGLALTPILGVLLALAAGPVGLVISALGLGALGYQTRRRIETGTTPGPKEALLFARTHALALTFAPILLSIVALAPPILLAIKSLVGWIPGIGEPAAGLTFGLDLLLSAATLFFGLAAALGWSLSSSIVAFEETGVVGTVKAILALVKNAFPRFVLWSILPRMAVSALAGVLFFGALLVAAPAVALNFKVLTPVFGVVRTLKHVVPSFGPSPRSDDENPWKSPSSSSTPSSSNPSRLTPSTPAASHEAHGLESRGLESHGLESHGLESRGTESTAPDAPFEITVGLFGIVLWCFVLVGVVVATLASTQTALNGLLYLACRPGNDERVTHDQWLATQQGGDRARS